MQANHTFYCLALGGGVSSQTDYIRLMLLLDAVAMETSSSNVFQNSINDVNGDKNLLLFVGSILCDARVTGSAQGHVDRIS